ncbi:DUF456 family protein [Paenibacillus sp. HB172176]|uniref:DUF456 domain-containing protein n=1 Tax=Paenibacillus sp. HB172176 TaxID=2493690 RepID=UPI00143B7B1E|nr:DUF456 family protein [Paenibacillus sp. HB172176]
MDILGWVIIILLFAVGMAGAIYPILPGALAIYAAFFVYGWFFTFQDFGFFFWTIQTLIVAALFIADHAVSAWGVKRFGGTKASIIGSTIGIIFGPFVIPAFGIVLGPFIGAILGELMVGTSVQQSFKAGWGAVVGLFTSVIVKFLLQLLMIILFVIWIWML